MIEENPFHISPVTTTRDLDETVALLKQYAASLPVDLSAQAFATELANLHNTYAGPGGILLRARSTGASAAGLGCVALRPFVPARPPDERDAAVDTPSGGGPEESREYCVVKRLYVLPSARGTGLGRALAVRVIDAARARGYRAVRLDTLRSMEGARSLYASLGFREVEAYEWAPYGEGETVFMERELRGVGGE